MWLVGILLAPPLIDFYAFVFFGRLPGPESDRAVTLVFQGPWVLAFAECVAVYFICCVAAFFKAARVK